MSKKITKEPQKNKEQNVTDATTQASAEGWLEHSWRLFRKEVHDVFSLFDDTDVEGTIANIHKGIHVKGSNAWILLASTLLASIGLNMNSPAIIIGAMLISPLMSPILGLGLSVGINDKSMLLNSMKQLAIAIGVSLAASTIYFLITPLHYSTPELLTRTEPTILDVFVATFGGVAGIIAISRIDKSNAIPGVAIATALMPPLCTAGYGLATAQWAYFFGALYLFFINAVFISLTTYFMVRYLRFPYKQQVDELHQSRVRKWILAFSFVVIIPSTFLFYKLIIKSRETAQITQFKEDLKAKKIHILDYDWEETDSTRTLSFLYTGKSLNQDSLQTLIQNSDYVMRNVQLKMIHTSESEEAFEQFGNKLKEEIAMTTTVIDEKQVEIERLQQTLMSIKSDTLPVHSLYSDVKILFPDLQQIGLSRQAMMSGVGNAIDTLPILIVKWSPTMRRQLRNQEEDKLSKYLQNTLKLDTLTLIRQ